MLDQDIIEQQKALLIQHRRRLALLFQQQARLGDYAPPHILLEIEDTQTTIRKLKETLSSAGAVVEDEPNDDTQPSAIVFHSHLTPQERRNRGRMLQKVHDFWIKGVLENSLHGAALIELGMDYKPDAIQHPWDMVIQQPDKPTRSVSSGIKIIDVFDELGGELLILGAPGSGKTTMLLDLARDLIGRAQQDETYPIPVVFNLSSWAEKRKPLVDWLVDELNAKYDVPRKIGKAWVDADQMLLLLDGLDEVKEEYRGASLEAINAFRGNHGLVNMVVCSRIADYEALATRVKLQGAVLIEALTAEQIDAYVASFGDQLRMLRIALTEDAMLRELAEAPLMLSIMVVAYEGTSGDEPTIRGTSEEQRRRLFSTYIERMFARRGIGARYTRATTMQWLGWLARGMLQQAQSVFLIERLQPEWLSSKMAYRRYIVVDRLLLALLSGLTLALVINLIGLQNGIFLMGLIGIIVLGLFGTETRKPTNVLGRIWSLVRGLLRGGFVVVLVSSAVIILLGAILLGFLFTLVGEIGDVRLVGLSGIPSFGLIFVVAIVLMIEIGRVVARGFFGRKLNRYTNSPVSTWILVRDAIMKGFIWMLIGSVVLGLCGAIVLSVLNGASGPLILGLIAALIVGLYGGESEMELIIPGPAWPQLRKALLSGLGFGAMGSVLGGLVFGANGIVGSAILFGLAGMLIGAIAGNPSLRPRRIILVETLRWSFSQAIQSAIRGIRDGFVAGWRESLGIGTMFGVFFGVLFGLRGGLREAEVTLKVIPNEGIRRSVRSAIKAGFFFGLVSGLFFGLVIGLFLALVSGSFSELSGGLLIGNFIGLFFGLCGALSYGGYACLSHLALRLVLWRSGSIPWNYARFLDYCAERIFLRKVGGGYIFIHRMLMEYFAELDTEEPAQERQQTTP